MCYKEVKRKRGEEELIRGEGRREGGREKKNGKRGGGGGRRGALA